jgi:F-type H+-transporting ATPase subunit delta
MRLQQAPDERNVATDDTIVEGMAGRYASALFDLAKEASQVKEVEAELTKFQGLLDESEDLRRMVRSPVISSDEQARAMDAIMTKAEISGLAGNFLKLLTSNRRLFAVADMIKGFRSLAAKDRGEVTAEVASAAALTDAQVEALKASLKASIGKDVTLATRVDPSLLGGLVVKVGSKMIDSSLKTKLQNLKVSLNGLGA